MADIGALCSAAIAGDVDAIAMLEMEDEKLWNDNYYWKTSILHTEAEKGNTEHVRFIVRNIANKKNLWVRLDWANQTALHRAVICQHCDVVEVLIDGARNFFQDNNDSSFPANDDDPHKSVSPFQAYIRQVNNIESDTALYEGVKRGFLRCVKMLVEADPTDRHTLNYHGKSPLYTAAEEGKNDIVKMICTTCTAPSLDGPGGSTALHAAIKHLKQAMEEDIDAIKMIINTAKRSCTLPYGSFEDLFNQTDESGHTVLRLALMKKQFYVIDLILKEDPAYQHSGSSEARQFNTLIVAIKKRDKDLVLHLLRYAEHLTSFAEHEGWTALHYAAYHEFDSILDTLIEAQKDFRNTWKGFVYNREGQITPLLIAAEKGYTSTVIRLMELWPTSSSSLLAYTAINNDGRNILHLAAAKNKKEMIEGILKYCPEKYKDNLLKQQDANGDTPLHLLISHGCFIPKLIKHKGLDTTVRNKKNWTPRDMLYSSVDIIADQMKKDLERYKKRTSTQIIVATLITTVTFTVGFTMPGGLRQSGEVNEGLVVLVKKAAFNAFMVSDALAFLLSTCSLFLYFLESMYEDPRQVSILNAASVGLNIISVMAMMLTFITGTYVVLSHSPAVAVTVCLIGSFFFIFVIVLLIKMVYDRHVKRNDVFWMYCT